MAVSVEPYIPGAALANLRRRFEAKVDRSGECHVWTGSLTTLGYGQIANEHGRKEMAHRVAYRLETGEPVPVGLESDHLCEVRRCVRWHPRHIVLATHRENIARSQSPWGINARKTHCHLGHPLAGGNLVIDNRGARQCRLCNNRRHAECLARKAAR